MILDYWHIYSPECGQVGTTTKEYLKRFLQEQFSSIPQKLINIYKTFREYVKFYWWQNDWIWSILSSMNNWLLNWNILIRDIHPPSVINHQEKYYLLLLKKKESETYQSHCLLVKILVISVKWFSLDKIITYYSTKQNQH